MWAAGLDWDDLFQGDLARRAWTWFSELGDLPEIKVPRCVNLGQDEELLSETLHTFVDASQDAYGAVNFSRVCYKSGLVSRRLVTAKTRVAPLSTTTISRLELMVAVLGLRMPDSVSKALDSALNQVTFWSDSMNVLWWIRGRSRSFKPFVANRVGEIQSLTDPQQWQFVPTKENPADLVTRGLKVSELGNCEKWWNDPEFLGNDESEWPINRVNVGQETTSMEIKRNDREFPKQANDYVEERTMISLKENKHLWCLNPNRFSSWQKFIRVQAWVHRFINNCRLRERESGELKPGEIEDAEIQPIKSANKKLFPTSTQRFCAKESYQRTANCLD